MGGAAAAATPKEVMKKLIGELATQYSPEEVKFGGVLGMLDVAYRVQPVDDIDIARMRWACKVLDETHIFRTALGDLAARGDIYSRDTWGPALLRRISVTRT